MRLPRPSDPVTIEQLEKCLDILADAISKAGREGDLYFPIWERIEKEIELRRQKQDLHAAVRERLRRSKGQTAVQSS